LRLVGEILLVKTLVSTTIAAVALCATPVFAADMPLKAVKAPPAPQWNWTGFYLGGYAGVGVNRSHGVDPTGNFTGEIDFLGTGLTGGLTAGYNWQFDPHWVVGIEGDFGYLGLNHESQQYNEALFVNSKSSWLGTLRGRVGYTSSGSTLAYVTGGAAWVHFDDTINVPGVGALESAKTKLGYAVGSGVETRLGGNWTVKSESLYVDVGHGDLLALPANFYVLEADKHRYLLQRFGLNYRFGGAPTGPLPQENWQGFFVGAVGGTAATQTRVSSTNTVGTVGELGNTDTGFTGGLIAGYNWQFAPQWVAGVEGDFSWLGINHTISDYNDPFASYKLNTRWIATARARLGYSTGPALLYVTGGAAWVNYEEEWHSPNSNPAFATATSTKTLSGFAAGGGIETTLSLFGLLGPGWFARSEYLYVDVGNGDTLTQAGFPVVADHQFHLFRGAAVYRFGG
jgi:outer membrane immunogenic protein